jgi:hypothetical protein
MGSGASSDSGGRDRTELAEIPEWAKPRPNQAVVLRRLDVDLGSLEDKAFADGHARRRRGERARRRVAEQLPAGANGSFKHSVSKSELLASRKALEQSDTSRRRQSQRKAKWEAARNW